MVPAARIPNPDQIRACASQRDHLRLALRGDFSCREQIAKSPLYGGFSLSGAGTRSRTPDLMITNQLLYQLSYAGEMRQGRELFPFVPGPARIRRPLRAIRANSAATQGHTILAVLLDNRLRARANRQGHVDVVDGAFTHIGFNHRLQSQ